jgi:hypothetical protein
VVREDGKRENVRHGENERGCWARPWLSKQTKMKKAADQERRSVWKKIKVGEKTQDVPDG